MNVHFDAVDLAGLYAMGSLLIVCMIAWMIERIAKHGRRHIPRLYIGPHQDAVDSLVQRRYETAIRNNAKATRAETTMAEWRRNPRSDGVTAQVIPMRRRHGR